MLSPDFLFRCFPRPILATFHIANVFLVGDQYAVIFTVQVIHNIHDEEVFLLRAIKRKLSPRRLIIIIVHL